MEMEMCGGYDCHISASKSFFCPKPRRFSPPHTFTHHFKCLQSLVSDSRAQHFDIILSMKLRYRVNLNMLGDKSSGLVASSPPFFFGSPPSRVSNPVSEDSRFGCDGATQVSPSVGQAMSPSSSGCRGVSFSRAKYGNKSVAVRIEGFNCLNVA